MKAMQRFICGLVVLGISLTLFGQIYLPLPLAGYEDLKADIAPYGWNIIDVVVNEEEGVVIVYYYYDKGEFAFDDTEYIKGLDVLAEWASHQGFLRQLLFISLYVEEGYTPDMGISGHYRMGFLLGWSATAIEYYLANASRFESFFHVLIFSQNLYWVGAGGADFIDQVWVPHPAGLWRNLWPKEHEKDWGHLR